MQTTRSPLELMRRAYELGQRVWAGYDSPFSRRDFTRPQLFACLVLRESLRLSYRKAEAFLRDVSEWLTEIGLSRAPDHNLTPRRKQEMLLRSIAHNLMLGQARRGGRD